MKGSEAVNSSKEYIMGLRTHLKRIIKKAIGRESNPPAPPYNPPTPDPVVAPKQPEPIETTDRSDSKSIPKVVHVKEEATPPQHEEKKVDEPAKEQVIESKVEETQEQPESEDIEGAFAVYPIKHLFGETCPKCGASTYNNWAYSNNAFICESCEATL